MRKNHHKFSYDSSGKFLFMRHGETRFNQDPDPYRQLYPGYIDCNLSEDGITQAKMCQEQINKLSIKDVYVSPFYRALQTTSICLENHPNISTFLSINIYKLNYFYYCSSITCRNRGLYT